MSMYHSMKNIVIHVIIEYLFSCILLSDEKDGRKSLYAVQAERQKQAERSVLISCHSRTNEKKFLKYLSRHGDINKYFFYESYVSEKTSICDLKKLVFLI